MYDSTNIAVFNMLIQRQNHLNILNQVEKQKGSRSDFWLIRINQSIISIEAYAQQLFRRTTLRFDSNTFIFCMNGVHSDDSIQTLDTFSGQKRRENQFFL